MIEHDQDHHSFLDLDDETGDNQPGAKNEDIKSCPLEVQSYSKAAIAINVYGNSN
jgi:hypothetical protein